ncbi:MAG: PKD domain-containing protein, partial [Chloroflexi bacterium]|nr:PKD domain-containing protein [Chloroflexota bacterium]
TSAAGAGLSWSWDGYNHIYLLKGDGTNDICRYRIDTNVWESLPGPGINMTVSRGPALARIGSYLYAYGTPGAYGSTNLYRYGSLPASDLRLTMDNTAIVLPDTATSFAWTNLYPADGDYRFRTDIDSTNVWVGPASAALTPALPTGATRVTSAQAAFVAPASGLYRLGAGSLLTAGYHTYVATAHVYTSQEACSPCASGSLTWGVDAYGTIREAVESGAARVLVHPGRYPQRFYLVSGVSVMGSGADSTIIEPPAGSGALVTAEGVAAASLARLTLAGGASWQGLLVEGGARDLTLTRCIIRDLSVGVRLRGDSTVEMMNNTIIRNGDGIIAEGSTPVDLRNTILAYNTDTGLERGATPTSLTNIYNDYWANGTDMNYTDAGGAKLYRDPQFIDLYGNDLRLSADSDLIDKGAPTDPTLPGGGTRVDIGYAEYNAANYYVSKIYSETGLNDGLVWGVDAFDTIQAGLDAAGAALVDLQGALPEGGYSVGVDDGTYTERVTVPSHVRLVGSGAGQTIIDADGAGSAVTFDAVIDAGVASMTLEDASAAGAAVQVTNAASGIQVTRNVIRNCAGPGVSLEGSSSAAVEFCTIVDNVGAGVRASDAGTWVRVENSILHGNALGLQAAASALIRNDYNLLNNDSEVEGATAGPNSVEADPAFAPSGHYSLSATSPALDAADPNAAVPTAGGMRADMGYKELIASPLTVVFGPQVASTVIGNSGVAKVEYGVVAVADASQPVTATLPSSWTTLTPTTSGQALYRWSASLSKATAGLYRVYSRAADAAGNVEENAVDWYEGAFVVDTAAPTVTWGTPALPTSTSAAAVLAVAEVSGTLNTGSGTRNDVSQVYYSVTGPSVSRTYPAPRGKAWIALPNPGTYAISVVAVDQAGNQTQLTRSVTVAASASEVSVSEPVSGSAVSATSVHVSGYVRFTAAGSGAVALTVDSTTVQATLDAPGARFSAWTATIELPTGDGAKTVTVTPSLNSVAGTAATLNLTLDTAAPVLSLATPAEGACVDRTVSFTGTASDEGGGLAAVEVSIDGGYIWRRTELVGSLFGLDWDLSGVQDKVTYPVRVRALDMAGNALVVARPVSVDSMPPTGLTPATFDQPVGQHLELGADLGIAWNDPVDAGGAAQVTLAVDQAADTVPSAEIAGTSSSATLDAVGDWYVHLMASDAVGNESLHHYGPWHVRDMGNATFSARRQSILCDGFIDLEHDEWLASDLLGTDAQGLETQQLYASWDGEAIYLGWSGAWWSLDGALWAYLDLADGGSTQSVDAAYSLPLAADLAIEISGEAVGTLYRWGGSAWVAETESPTFANGPSGDTEVRIVRALDASRSVELVAFGLPEALNVGVTPGLFGGAMLAAESADPWVIFPNTNPLGQDPADVYTWDTPIVDGMNVGQPTATTVWMSVSSPQAAGTAWCAGSTLAYIIALTNPGLEDLSGLTLDLVASTGLAFDSVSGATLTSESAEGSIWELSVPTLAAGAVHDVTVSAKLANVLSGLSDVTNAIVLSADSIALAGETEASVTHRVDSEAPTASITVPAGAAVRTGAQMFTGAADDGTGSGVALVEVSGDGGATWVPATGTLAWSAEVTVPDGAETFELKARATDACGATGEVATQLFGVDSTPPAIAWTVPAVITATVAHLDGTTVDPAPAGALVARVDVQIDGIDGAWYPATGPQKLLLDAQAWTWGWSTPHDDGVVHMLRARATDGVGLTTLTVDQATIVDTVAPAISVLYQPTTVTLPDDEAQTLTIVRSLDQVQLDGRQPGALSQPKPLVELQAAPVTLISGLVTDGAGVQAVRVLVYGPEGGVETLEAQLEVGAWQCAPDLTGWLPGVYSLRVQALDIHGNTSMAGPYGLTIADQAIEGLAAHNDGPRMIGQEVTLTASVTHGSNITYAWTFGDGATGTGSTVTHAYTTEGTFTATVTASNSVNSLQAQTQVTLWAMSVEAGPDQPTVLEGATVLLAATFVDGRADVVHSAAIDWGNGVTATGEVDEALDTIAGSYAYADNGTYTVTVTLTDDGTPANSVADSLAVTVGNVAPTATFGNDGPVDEASAVTVSFTSVLDPGSADTLTYSIDWDNDGAWDVEQATPAAQHTWTDNGTYTVKGRISDDDGAANDYTTDVVVSNATPRVNAGADADIIEGGTFISSGSFTDPGADSWTAAVDYGDGSAVQALAIGSDKSFALSHTYDDDGAYTVIVCVTDDDIAVGCDEVAVTVANVAPGVEASPLSQTVPYSEEIVTIVFTATDVTADSLSAALSWSSDGVTWYDGAPAGLTLDEGSCATSDGVNACTWTVTGAVGVPEGTYTLRLAVADDGDTPTSADVTLVVDPEEAVVVFSGDNPSAVLVASPGGQSGTFSLQVCVSERDVPLAGDISLAEVSMSLVPVGPGVPVQGVVVATQTGDAKCVTFSFSGVPVNAYLATVEVDGGYYTGSSQDVLVVYDPSLGFTTGGGWFYWPDTADEATGYAGDRTTFGYTIKYNKKTTNLQGNLVMIRHLADGTIYRVKSNALNGLAIGEEAQVPMGWATFRGKCTYQEPTWLTPVGNFGFTVYAEDRDEPGTGIDRFWI